MTEIPRLTPEQAAILTAYTGIELGAFAVFHAYAEQLLGRPILTREFADGSVWVQLHEASRRDLLDISVTAAVG